MTSEQISVLYYCTVLIFAIAIYISSERNLTKRYRKLEEEFRNYRELSERYFQESGKLFDIYKEKQAAELKRILSKSVSIGQDYCDNEIEKLKKDILEDDK